MYLREALSYVDYNVDTGNKTTLQTSVKNSSIKCAQGMHNVQGQN